MIRCASYVQKSYHEPRLAPIPPSKDTKAAPKLDTCPAENSHWTLKTTDLCSKTVFQGAILRVHDRFRECTHEHLTLLSSVFSVGVTPPAALRGVENPLPNGCGLGVL